MKLKFHVAQFLVVSESMSDDDDDEATGSKLLNWAYCKTFSGLAHVEKCLVGELNTMKILIIIKSTIS